MLRKFSIYTILIVIFISFGNDKVDRQAVIEHRKAYNYYITEVNGTYTLENTELSLKHYKKVVEIEPNYPDPSLYINIFYCYENRHQKDENYDYKDILEYFKNIEKEIPNNTGLILAIAKVYSRLENKEETEKYLGKITDFEPFYADIYFDAVIICRWIKNKTEENRFLVLDAKGGNEWSQKFCDELGLNWRDE